MFHRAVRNGCGLAAAVLAVSLAAAPAVAQSDAPITIGLAMSVTGPATNGKQALAGAKIWEEETNAKGGLLGRKVKLVTYDDQSNPANVPRNLHQASRRGQGRPRGQRLRDQHGRARHAGDHAKRQDLHRLVRARCEQRIPLSKILFHAADRSRHEGRVYSRLLRGGAAAESETDGGALASEDAEFARNACAGARENAKRFGVNIIYDKTFPPGTTDFSPIIRALQAANADLVVVCSYPLSSVGIVQSANELNFTPKMFGGAMVGLQATVFKDRLNSKMNGIVNYETWVPSEKLMAPAAASFKTYQEHAEAEGRSARLLSRRLGLRLLPGSWSGDPGRQQHQRR